MRRPQHDSDAEPALYRTGSEEDDEHSAEARRRSVSLLQWKAELRSHNKAVITTGTESAGLSSCETFVPAADPHVSDRWCEKQWETSFAELPVREPCARQQPNPTTLCLDELIPKGSLSTENIENQSHEFVCPESDSDGLLPVTLWQVPFMALCPHNLSCCHIR